ncbi:hypothetical protein [Pseudomonas sp.]|uniref:hypothetical protein n=1 Tax=Pseudomonas sp. TaxID=306 RepID=UPI002587FBB3|nr:hypothetical protein [Pseudomonas sp.]
MLSDKEIAAFLALLQTFCFATRTSARSLAKLLGITPNTAARWLRAARGLGGVDRLYHVNVDQIIAEIEALNRHNAKSGAFNTIAAIADPMARLKELQVIKAQLQ